MNDHRRLTAAFVLLAALLAGSPLLGAPVHPVDVVELHSDTSPLVSIRLQFNAGSIYDPPGKEGLASLTGLMIAEAGTRKHSYSALAEAFYPMAASIGVNVDREVAVIAGTIHRDQLDAYTGLFEEALFQPAFAESDFQRNKALLLSILTDTLRAGSDELLGLEMLQDQIFAGTPYGHPAEGTVESLQRLTVADVKAFYQEHFTRGGLLVGVAGGYPKGYVERLANDLAALPAGTQERKALPPVRQAAGRAITLIEKQTSTVGINLGFPLPVNRSDADYFPLMVANSYLGEHRSFYGRLMNQLRGARGLNYGDYSYIEYWNNPPNTEQPTPNVPRRQQYFSVWIRPVAPADAQFALRDGLYEVRKLHDEGMSRQDFEATRDLLINYSKLWAGRLSDRLGFLMDSKFYGTPYYIDEIEARLKTMTLEQVNAAARKYLDPTNFDAVLVTGNAAQLKDVLQKDDPSPKKYTNPVAPAVLEADKTIQALKIQPTKIEVVPVDQVFQK
ncbi:MAG TPA: pitrilysin family protein [Thermoanaerobaculia bacterium]|jgi:zinc protease|nr:pitrilysin family protein [Thermoanaerobaculia bacterium]